MEIIETRINIPPDALCEPPFAVVNRSGQGKLVLICEHASHLIPAAYLGLGLSAADQLRHIGWDIGALGLAKKLSVLLDAPLVHATYSRLLLDLNRSVGAPDSIVTRSEDTSIPGNQGIAEQERELRMERIYAPFHAQLDALIDQRLEAGLVTAVVSIHSFTPNYNGYQRPWHVGVISQDDRLLADALLAALVKHPELCVGDNLPYGPQDGVFHSLERHAPARGLRGAMIEVRNDLIGDDAGQNHWARLLYAALDCSLSDQTTIPKTGRQP